MRIGEKASISKEIKKSDIDSFSKITGDFNPLHIDEDFAKRTQFGGIIAHGMLVGSLISAVLGTKLPSQGAIYLSQTLKFLAPVRIGDTITASVEIIDIIERENKSTRVKLKTICKNQSDKLVIEGEALMQLTEKFC